MQRIPEPELMEDIEQAKAYDAADFSESHGRRVTLFAEKYGREIEGAVLDLGCGSGDILERFARRYPRASFTGVDASEPMLELSRGRMARAGFSGRVDFLQALIPSPALQQRQGYAVVMSHSLLHHLHQPVGLWKTIRHCAGGHSAGHHGVEKGSFVFVADLRRPSSAEEAARIVEKLSGGEPEVLRRDFYNSLCAAFTAEEIRQQLKEADMTGLTVEETGEIHILAYGQLA